MLTATLKRSGMAAAVVAFALTLSGCLDVKADVTVDSEATATGNIAFEFQKQAASFLGISDLAGFSEIFTGEGNDLSAAFPAESCTSTESDAAYSYTCTFTGMAFTDPEGPWQISKEGENVVFSFASNSSGVDQLLGDGSDAAMGAGSLGTVAVDVTMPGIILTADGPGVTKTSDTSATVKGELGGDYEVTITSESGASGGGFVAALIAALVGLAVILLVVIVAIVLLRRRRSPEAIATESAFAAAPAGIEESVAAEAAAEAALPALPGDEAPSGDDTVGGSEGNPEDR